MEGFIRKRIKGNVPQKFKKLMINTKDREDPNILFPYKIC